MKTGYYDCQHQDQDMGIGSIGLKILKKNFLGSHSAIRLCGAVLPRWGFASGLKIARK